MPRKCSNRLRLLQWNGRFNEAAAKKAAEGAKIRVSPISRRSCFNEAAATKPRKTIANDDTDDHWIELQ